VQLQHFPPNALGNILTYGRPLLKSKSCKPLKTWGKSEISKKDDEIAKKGLRVFGVIRKHPLTGGAEALTGRQTGRRAEVRMFCEAHNKRQRIRVAP
jgi:magnesium-transporting ATPase (P-type)